MHVTAVSAGNYYRATIGALPGCRLGLPSLRTMARPLNCITPHIGVRLGKYFPIPITLTQWLK